MSPLTGSRHLALWGGALRQGVLHLTTAALLAACATAPVADGAPPESKTVALTALAAPRRGAKEATTPFALAEVMRAVRFAYRSGEAGWIGAGSAYEVRASAAEFAVTPVSQPRQSPRGSGLPPRPGDARSAVGAEGRRSGAPATISVVELARGGHSLIGASARGVRIAKDGHLTVEGGEVSQHLRNVEEGVELSFAFEARPRGAGDVTVRLRVSGEQFIGETATGHHFADSTTGLGVRVGRATWIDARGAKTPVASRAVRGGLELRVPAGVLDASVYPAVLDPLISPEQGIDTPALIPSPGDTAFPAVAFAGTHYLAVWLDYRSGPRIYGTRVALDGSILDPIGIYIGDGAMPKVASDGTDFLVSYRRSNTGTGTFALRAARVTEAGVVLDPTGIELGATTSTGVPAVTFNGTDYVVAWNQGASVRRARVAPSGTVLDPGGIVAVTSGTAPGVASEGSSSLLVWRGTDSRLHGMRIDAAGLPLDPDGVLITPAGVVAASPSVAFDGTQYVVAWSSSNRVWATRVALSGAVLDPAGIAVAAEGDPDYFLSEPAIAFDGTNSVILWSRNHPDADCTFSSVQTARLSPGGIVISGAIALSNAGGQPAIASNGAGALTLWFDPLTPLTCFSATSIAGTRLSPGGVPLDPRPLLVSTATNTELDPSVAFDGENYFVVWSDDRNVRATAVSDIYGARVSPTGLLLDTTAIQVQSNGYWKEKPAAIFNGTNTLVAWWEAQGTPTHGNIPSVARAVRISPLGAILDPSPLVLPLEAENQFHEFAVARSRAGETLIASANYASVDAVIVDATGVVGPRIPISSATAHGILHVGASFDGTNTLVVWSDDRTAAFGVFGARVSPEGIVLDPEGFRIAASSSAEPMAVAVTYDGTNHIVTWKAKASRAEATHVRAARVAPNGEVLDEAGINLARALDAGCDALPGLAAAFDGAHTLVTWSSQSAACGETALLGVELNGAAAVTSTLTLSTGPGYRSPPALVSDGAGNALVAYARFHDETSLGSVRVNAMLITQDKCADTPIECPPADACHEAATCDPVAGCLYAAKPDGAPCGEQAVCAAGICVGGGQGGQGGQGGRSGASGPGSTSSAGGAGGAGGHGGSDLPDDHSPGSADEGGCGCGVAGDETTSSARGIALAVVGLRLAARRRRRAVVRAG